MSCSAKSFECENCGETTSQTSYDVNGETWCNDCYTKEYYPDVWEQEQSNNAFLKRCEKDDCNCCSNPETDDDELTEINCGHKFCSACFEDIEKFNKCVECFETIDDEAEPNKEICGSCFREMCDCICYYKRPITDNKDEIFYYALFFKLKNNINHSVIRKIVDMFESDYGYKDFDYDNQKIEDIEVIEEYDNCYVIQLPHLKYNPNKPQTASNQQYTRLRLEYYTEPELDERVNEYVKENIQYFNRNFIFNNLKPNIYKEIIEPESDDDEEVEEPEKIYDNDTCPICLDCYDENKIKKVSSCGHTFCFDCHNHIINSNNPKCPNCRVEWSNNDDETNEPEYIEWELEDIEELCENEENEVLNEIININGVCEDAVMMDGYAHTLGYEECEQYINTRFRGEVVNGYYILVGDY